MTHPDPLPPSAPAEPAASVSSAGAETPPGAEAPPQPPGAWDLARADYEAGEPVAVVAERLGVNERTVYRRMARCGWRREGRRDEAAFAAAYLGLDPRLEKEHLDPDSPMTLFVTASEYETGELLMAPDPQRYLRFTFRRAAEAAVMRRPAEALAWARAAAAVEKLSERINVTGSAFHPADYIRATYAERLMGAADDDRDEAAG